MAALTKRIIEQDRLTAIMVTHSMQQAVQLSDRIIMMHQGRIIQSRSQESILKEVKSLAADPDFKKRLTSIKSPAGTSIQKLTAFTRGKAMSRAPIWIGTT